MKKYLISISLVVCALLSAWAEEMPANYYDAINGTQDSILKGTLKTIIRNHTEIPYGSGASSTWGVFYYSDRNAEGYIMDMYCDTWQKVSSPGEVASGCNIEHSLANSWWGAKEHAPYKDCYHLNPSNQTANSSRSNYPLGVPIKDFKSNTGSLKVGKIHHDSLNVDFYVFEPKDEYKGDFARAYFYVVTCYGRDLNGEYPDLPPTSKKSNYGWRLDNDQVGSKFAMQNDNYLEFQPWEQEVLITWHRQDPVSIKEINRADAVSDFQHNRNPFIDYPYLAEYIWGERAGEEVEMANLVASFDDDFVPGESNGWREGGTPPAPKPKYGVTWTVNGEELRVDSIVENKKIPALPDKPVSCSAESSEFIGWTPNAIPGTQDEAPAVLYTKPADIPAITEDISLYAVFARKTTVEGSEPATYTFDADHQTGWTNTGTSKSGYWLLSQGNELTSPEVNLAGLSSITVTIRTFGGTGNNTLNVSANDETIATITTNKGTTLTDFTWTNDKTLTGKSPITFSTNYSSGNGVGISSAIINATGISVTYDRYITSCQTATEIINTSVDEQAAKKILIGGQMYILVGEQLFTITGQKVR